MKKRRETNTILVIEDEADVRNFAARVLELEGYHVLRAENGEEGLRLLREGWVNLVLLDLKLPGLDGWTVLERIKSAPELSVIPVIVFTASAGVPQQKKALRMGAAYYLVKPLSADDLKEAVVGILNQER